MNISIAIADTDHIYLERLGEVLQEYEDLSVSIFTNAHSLEEALAKKHYDVVLFDPDISEKKLELCNTRLAVCLYSGEAQNTALYLDYEKVKKYQRISKLYKEIIKIYADKSGYIPDFENFQNTRLISVYSPIGGSGKTTIALSLASMFSAMGEKVLFMNFEQLDSTMRVNPHTDEADGITRLFESLDDNTNFELKLKSITKKGINGISYIEGFERIVDYNSVSADEMRAVLERVVRYGSYGIVIADMESRLDALGQTMFEVSDKIVVVERPEEVAQEKINLFTRQALTCECLGKMCKIINFTENINTKNQLSVPCIGKIRNFGNFSQKSTVQMIAAKAVVDMRTLMN